MQIHAHQFEAAYGVAERVYKGELRFEEGATELHTQFDLNINSARDFISDFRHMLSGEVFQRAMSAPATNYFLARIERERGKRSLETAVSAVEKHIAYYEGLPNKGRLHKLRSVLEAYRPQTLDIAELASRLNVASIGRSIGSLQALRSRLKQRKRRMPAQIFSGQTIRSDYAFHVGGRSELQFNFGLDADGASVALRYGVAFSFETSRSFPDIAILIPKVARFNEFLRVYPDEFADYRMWQVVDGDRSGRYAPSPISPEICRNGAFIFLGERVSTSDIDIDRILDTFDRLLPLYAYVEGTSDLFPEQAPVLDAPSGAFVPGCTIKKSSTTATLTERSLDIALRHNDLQSGLYEFLTDVHGAAAVATEHRTSTGTRVDVAVHSDDGMVYYEIKTDLSARACVRAALAQLLEYSYWPGGREARELVVVGEPPIDDETKTFLGRLNEGFGLPIRYARFDARVGKLRE